MRLFLAASSAVVFAAFQLLPAAAQPDRAPRAPIDVSKLGPQVGQVVPDFRLVDQGGAWQTRQSIMGPRGAMLVFIRSADWWPYCKTQLVELQGRLKELQARGLGVAAISYDSPAILAAFSRQRGITFPLLSDAGSATIKAFGILNPAAEWGLGPGNEDPAVASEVQKYVSGGRPSPMMIGIPFPGTFVVDRRGRVAARFFEDYYVERQTFSSVMLKLDRGLPGATAAKISTPQLELTTFASDSSVAAGNRFSLVFDVTPRAGMHVYAPGASGYRVISVVMTPAPFVRFLPVDYPRSEIYLFEPLNERVQVYQKPFRLVQDVVLEGTPQAQAALQGKDTLTLSGSVEYQACDDKVCFNPASIPLTWTVSLRPLTRERPIVPK